MISVLNRLKLGINRVLLDPAPDRMPAVEAVAIIEPPGTGFEGPVFCIAFEACLTARKTLSELLVCVLYPPACSYPDGSFVGGPSLS